MHRVLTALVLVPVVLLAVFKTPLWLYALILAGVALLATHEYLNITAAHHLMPLRTLTYISVAAVLCDYYLSILIRSLRPTNVTGWPMLRDPFFQYEILLVLV